MFNLRYRYIQSCFIAVLSITVLQQTLMAQGCSDAGFCTIGSFKHDSNGLLSDSLKQPKHRISFLAPMGVGDENVFVFTPALQYDLFVTNSLALQGKITANYASGNLGNAFGAGDVYLSAIYRFPHKGKWFIEGTLGTKLPLNQSNLEADGRSLPMQYQSSLGTIDLIAGISFSNGSWQFSAGWQQPLSGINQNHFLPVYWQLPEASRYPSTNDLNRKADLLLRIGKNFRIGNNVVINTGLLNILHTGKDEYIDANVSNRPIKINGSEGLTVNLTAAVWWQVNRTVRIGLAGGSPLVVRDVRPDGLTRKFVLSPEINWSF